MIWLVSGYFVLYKITEKALRVFRLEGLKLKEGGLLLSRIALQYHRRKRA